MIISITADAQFLVYKNVPDPPSSSYSIPNFSFPDPAEEIMRENAAAAAAAAARARAMEIVSSDIITADGFNYYSETYSPLKVKRILRRNGQSQFFCLGIKKNGKWISCEQEIVSLETMYKNATKEADKNSILELMEYGNYLLVINIDTEVYFIK